MYALNDKVNIVNQSSTSLKKTLNMDVMACYLKYGILPPPGNKGFFAGENIS